MADPAELTPRDKLVLAIAKAYGNPADPNFWPDAHEERVSAIADAVEQHVAALTAASPVPEISGGCPVWATLGGEGIGLGVIQKHEPTAKQRAEADLINIQWVRAIVMLSASPPAPVPEGWRDIASAPRDGTKFLVRQGDWIAVAFYKPNPHPKAVRSETLQVNLRPNAYCAASGWINPTHWMPLPAPPSAPEAPR